jgi:hypothetical protein
VVSDVGLATETATEANVFESLRLAKMRPPGEEWALEPPTAERPGPTWCRLRVFGSSGGGEKGERKRWGDVDASLSQIRESFSADHVTGGQVGTINGTGAPDRSPLAVRIVFSGNSRVFSAT